MRPIPAVLVMLGAVWAARQAPSTLATRLAAMKPLEGWVGEWRGSGWSMGPTGQRTEFELTESVQRRVGGTALLVEGHGHVRGDSTRVTHDGLSVVYYDEKTGKYRWNGHETAAGTVDVDARVTDGGLEWSVRAPQGGTARFTIKFDAAVWTEVGEASADGKTWNRFMEMQLKRTAAR